MANEDEDLLKPTAEDDAIEVAKRSRTRYFASSRGCNPRGSTVRPGELP
jgi:hypothetical protein